MNLNKTLLIVGFALVGLVIASLVALKVFRLVFGLNLSEKEPYYVLYIPSGSNYDTVLNRLERDTVLKDIRGFEWLAHKLKYPENVKPGRYILHKEMTNKDIVKKLRSGRQDPVDIFFNKYRRKEDLAGFVSKRLEVDSARLVMLLNDPVFLSQYQLNPENAIAIFLSDKYEFFWTTDANRLIERMHEEYKKYWNSDRVEKAEELGLTPGEVITLASIVEEETNIHAEKTRMAGVYLNRIRKGMRLEADPTVKFAIQDFEVRRVLKRHLTFNSPYNTYVVTGLPPGPICSPSKKSIEAVLNAEDHDYIFFCAKDDFSGAHAFAKTYAEHQENARRFQRALTRNNIMR